MPFIFNGVTINTVYFNGVEIDTVNFNGTEVFSSGPAITATPTITGVGYVAPKLWLSWTVRNEDTTAGTVWVEPQDSTPDAWSSAIGAYPSTVTKSNYSYGMIPGNPITVYAKCQATGKELSAYDSYYFDY